MSTASAVPSPILYLLSFSLAEWIAIVALLISIAGIVVIFLIERHRRPHLTVGIGNFADSPRTPRFRILHVIVLNQRKAFVAAETAINCRGNITIEDFSTHQELLKDIGTKWATKPEPVRPIVTSTQLTGYYIDDALLAEAYTEEIAAGGERPLAIAIKFDGDSEFHAFGPESYRHNLKKPDYGVNSSKCLLSVTVTADNARSETAKFVLENPTRDIKDFILQVV
jgi:hypothetical protein